MLIIIRKRWRPQFSPRSGTMVNEMDNIMLEEQFSEKEIMDCVMACAQIKHQILTVTPWHFL